MALPVFLCTGYAWAPSSQYSNGAAQLRCDGRLSDERSPLPRPLVDAICQERPTGINGGVEVRRISGATDKSIAVAVDIGDGSARSRRGGGRLNVSTMAVIRTL
jgi:hypothetical protein